MYSRFGIGTYTLKILALQLRVPFLTVQANLSPTACVVGKVAVFLVFLVFMVAVSTTICEIGSLNKHAIPY